VPGISYIGIRNRTQPVVPVPFTEKDASFMSSVKLTCPTCHGEGTITANGNEEVTCGQCNGSGEIDG
jgi:DnaJ-class molecular chaperone